MAVTATQNAGGSYTVTLANGEVIYNVPANNLGAYGATVTSSSTPPTSASSSAVPITGGNLPAGSSTTYGATNTQPTASTSAPAVPSALYTALGQSVEGNITPQQATQQIQSLINSGTYSGTVDNSQLFSPSITVSGVNAQFDNSGSGTTIKPNATVNSSNTTSSGTTSSSSTASGGTSTGVAYNPAWSSLGVSQSTWNSMNPTQQATFAAAFSAGTTLANSGNNNVTVSAALSAAATDPNIIAQFSGQLNIDKETLQQSIATYQTAASTASQTQQMQFEADRQALANQYAAAGAAYSGFRGEAQQNLGETEQGIVTSSLSQLQQNLNAATQSFEQKYGTSATTPATATYTNPYASANYSLSGQYMPSSPTNTTVTGQLAGGVQGTQLPSATNPYGTGSVESSITSEANSIYQGGVTPNVVPA